MDTILLTWNPKHFSWAGLDASIQDLRRDGHLDGRWSCGNTRHITRGSRFFMVRLGEEPKGILAAGTVESGSYRATHWTDRGKDAWYVDVRFTVLRKQPFIPLSVLELPPFDGFKWTPQASGIRIPPDIAASLEKSVRESQRLEPGESLGDPLGTLEFRHRKALQWFLERGGERVGWPEPLDDGTLLVTQAKGIYKPKWSRYALSVRQALRGAYPDEEPLRQPDGGWTYRYFQEKLDPKAGRDEYTNKGLLACMHDHIPVGVMRQVSPKPHVLYEVLGLGQVVSWEEGFFTLEKASVIGAGRERSDRRPATDDLDTAQRRAEKAGEFNPGTEEDARDRILASVVRRRGQAAFRNKLLAAYGRRCALTGCDAEPALEAAHITPYRGPDTNSPGNGLLLRADIHTLWDLGLIAVDEATGRMLVKPSLRGTSYGELEGHRIARPNNVELIPSRQALELHRRSCGL